MYCSPGHTKKNSPFLLHFIQQSTLHTLNIRIYAANYFLSSNFEHSKQLLSFTLVHLFAFNTELGSAFITIPILLFFSLNSTHFTSALFHATTRFIYLIANIKRFSNEIKKIMFTPVHSGGFNVDLKIM